MKHYILKKKQFIFLLKLQQLPFSNIIFFVTGFGKTISPVSYSAVCGLTLGLKLLLEKLINLHYKYL